MHAGALRALEFDRVVEAVCRLATTSIGVDRLRGLRPLTDPRAVSAALSATSEGVSYLAEWGRFPLASPPDLDGTLTALAIEGRALEPSALLEFATFLASVDATRAAIRKAGRLPLLGALADAASSFDREIGEIRKKIDPAGSVLDDASPELKIIRERLRKQRARLKGTLESFLRGRDTAKYLQDQIVTDRNGRYVLVVKSEHRAAIPGIVHGSSSSGASLFLEPLSTVEINNDIVALEQQEADEVRRILLALTDGFRRRAADLKRTVEAAVELDMVQARARLSSLMDGVEPIIASDGRLELRAARHPLLVRAVRALLADEDAGAGAALEPGPVPVDLVLVPPTRVLVITGPNTGGKTVALKCAGLLMLMAQSGLHVPAAGGSQITVLRSVFADIGDEQSIAANLSTFSWHMTNIAAMDRQLALPALVLLDEVGAGTDPVEGGSLGLAIVDHFRTRGALVVATTHYDALKSYASTTEGVVCAAFGFDPETFAPTYRLHYGSPGRSLALEIASRLGLPEPVLEMARAQRSAREAQLADHLARMDRELAALEHERRLATREREALADEAARVKTRDEDLRQREGAFKKRLDERLEHQIRDARREIEDVVDALKAQAARLTDQARRAPAAVAPISTGDTGAARVTAHGALDAVEQRLRERTGLAAEMEPDTPAAGSPGAAPSTHPPVVGDRVAIAGLGLEGVVRAVHDRDAEVEVRGKRLRARLDELRLLEGSGPEPHGSVRVSVQLQPRDAVAADLNIIGCTVDEALTRAEKFLDEALMAEQRTLRVIHGYGTGQLRRAIAEFLRSHPLVASFGSAPDGQGGGGVTVVELKD
jgi:DNA mismatch repair protein MutS2